VVFANTADGEAANDHARFSIRTNGQRWSRADLAFGPSAYEKCSPLRAVAQPVAGSPGMPAGAVIAVIANAGGSDQCEMPVAVSTKNGCPVAMSICPIHPAGRAAPLCTGANLSHTSAAHGTQPGRQWQGVRSGSDAATCAEVPNAVHGWAYAAVSCTQASRSRVAESSQPRPKPVARSACVARKQIFHLLDVAARSARTDACGCPASPASEHSTLCERDLVLGFRTCAIQLPVT
jgi:hypothetical protein